MNRPVRFARAPYEGPKKPTNVSLNAELVEEARKLGINVSEACQTGLAAEVKKARETAWKEENRAAIEASNEYVRKHGLPLAKYRLF
ncbi:MAG: post-segregation antitoxin CcdA [Alphaproteobacteria bacterium HGW-Alphaproteobacteria-13]|nr:MAG: post-segregation antitoxin CcdA [Alphaproteobacteria bacterium HGW-Alphaproteobacteria-13]